MKNWTAIDHRQWPKVCPQCGQGLSNTSFEPYCSNAACLWNNDGSAEEAQKQEAQLAVLRGEFGSVAAADAYLARKLHRKPLHCGECGNDWKFCTCTGGEQP